MFDFNLNYKQQLFICNKAKTIKLIILLTKKVLFNRDKIHKKIYNKVINYFHDKTQINKVDEHIILLRLKSIILNENALVNEDIRTLVSKVVSFNIYQQFHYTVLLKYINPSHMLTVYDTFIFHLFIQKNRQLLNMSNSEKLEFFKKYNT